MIARDLGVKIVSGMLRPGSVLDGEVEASDQRKVSRSAYREAVRILVAKGLVHSKPKAGTRVNDRSAWHLLDPDVLSWIFQTEPDYALVYSLFELRRMVEPEAAALAADRRSASQLKTMAEALKVMSQGRTVDKEWRDADEKFHAALLEASGNDFLTSLTSSVNAAISWSTIFKQRHEPLKRDPMPDHRKVYLGDREVRSLRRAKGDGAIGRFGSDRHHHRAEMAENHYRGKVRRCRKHAPARPGPPARGLASGHAFLVCRRDFQIVDIERIGPAQHLNLVVTGL